MEQNQGNLFNYLPKIRVDYSFNNLKIRVNSRPSNTRQLWITGVFKGRLFKETALFLY